MSRKITNVIVHCSDSEWGDRAVIDDWHKKRGWRGIGYHYVVLNDYPTYNSYKIKCSLETEGDIEKGRPDNQDPFLDDNEIGAHVLGMNSSSIGICLIGKEHFSRHQKFSAVKLVCKLLQFYELTIQDVLGHCETPTGKEQGKTCPNIDMIKFRSMCHWALKINKFWGILD